MSVSIAIDDVEFRGALQQLLNIGRNPLPILKRIAAIGETQTRERFDSETDPDGSKWAPSQRVLENGGKTLTRDGILSGSITGQATIEYAEWGTNAEYAAAHQFGVKTRPHVIEARHASALSFNGIFRKRVNHPGSDIPKRAFLGVSADNAAEFLDEIEAMIRRRTGGAVQ